MYYIRYKVTQKSTYIHSVIIIDISYIGW